MKNPEPDAVIALRESVQARESLGITAAQGYCSGEIHANRRSWQQWEAGDRKMHPAFWELARIKLAASK